MKFDLTKPCKDCPFRNDIKPYLSKERVLELKDVTFSCHKTIDYSDDSEDGEGKENLDTRHCAGSLILHEKLERPHQMMRIAERIGRYNRHKLVMNSPVYDTFEEMAEAQPR